MIKSNGTILVVEDDGTTRFFVRQVLEQSGFTVLEACNGDEAIRIAERHLESLDLIVCDVVLPQILGTLVTKRLTALKPELKVIFISALPDVSSYGLNAMNANYLQKPFSQEALSQKVQEILGDQGKT